MKTILLLFFLIRISFIHAQGIPDVKGEIVFPFINQYSAYGLDKKSAKKTIAFYENCYQKAKRTNELNDEMRLFVLVKERSLLFSPYIIVRGSLDEETIVYMDSATYQKTLVWDYNAEELNANQNYLWFEARTSWLGENAYWLTEFKGMT